MGLLEFNSEPEFQKLSDMAASCQDSETARLHAGMESGKGIRRIYDGLSVCVIEEHFLG